MSLCVCVCVCESVCMCICTLCFKPITGQLLYICTVGYICAWLVSHLIAHSLNNMHVAASMIAYLILICDLPSKNQHSSHLRFWSFNDLCNVRKSTMISNLQRRWSKEDGIRFTPYQLYKFENSQSFLTLFYEPLDDQNQRCKLCLFLLRGSHIIFMFQSFVVADSPEVKAERGAINLIVVSDILT